MRAGYNRCSFGFRHLPCFGLPWFGGFLIPWVRIVDHLIHEEIREADRHRVGLIVTGVLPLADKLLERLGNRFLVGILVVGDQTLDRLGVDVEEFLATKSPGVEIGYADNLAENLHGLAGGGDIQERTLADNGGVRVLGEQAAEFGRNLGKLFPVAFLSAGVGRLVVEVGCLLYCRPAVLRVIPQDGEPGTLHREVTCDNFH